LALHAGWSVSQEAAAVAQGQEPADYALQLSEQEKGRFQRMAQRAMEREGDLMRRAGIVPGARVVDMGCGPGAMLVELARIAGEGGEVVGVEPDPTARAAAVQAIANAGLTNARVVDGRGTSSGLDEGVWDAVMVRHVLFHVGPQAQDLVAHAAALVRPGGHVYLVDTDLRAARLEPDEAGAFEISLRYDTFQRARGNDPGIGPRLHVLLAEAGLEVRAVDASFAVVPAQVLAESGGGAATAAQHAMMAAGALSEEEVQHFADARARSFTNPLAHAFLPQFVAVGRRPE
jgi:SAM-dependent methyltransferase